MSKQKVLFYGTPEIAVPFLETLADRETVVAVVSQPDKAVGRGLELTPTPVKKRALELGIGEIVQPPTSKVDLSELWKGASPRLAPGLAPDLAVVVAYGKIIKPYNLAIPKLGTLNVHFSLLPKYRGAAPVQWSLVRGETRTGVTIFWLDEGMDTGPVFIKKETPVGPDEDAPALMQRLVKLGIQALDEVLDRIKAGEIIREPQQGQPSLAPLIGKEDAKVDLERSASEIHNLVRGFRGWPKAWLQLEKGKLQVLKTKLSEEAGAGQPGTLVRVERDAGILVQCGRSSRLWFLEVQPEGKKPVTAADFLNGLRLAAGDRLPILR